MDGGRGDGGEEEVAREDHDGVRCEKRDEVGARFAESCPRAVFEGAYCGCDGGVRERWSRHRGAASSVVGAAVGGVVQIDCFDSTDGRRVNAI